MINNVDKVLTREDNLDTLHQKSEELQDQAGRFQSRSSELRKKMCMRNIKFALMIIFAILFFVGIIVLILGTLIIIFDYPQLQILDNLDSESYYMLDEEKKNIHQRMKIEITVGIGLAVTGIGLLAVSFSKRFENRLR